VTPIHIHYCTVVIALTFHVVTPFIYYCYFVCLYWFHLVIMGSLLFSSDSERYLIVQFTWFISSARLVLVTKFSTHIALQLFLLCSNSPLYDVVVAFVAIKPNAWFSHYRFYLTFISTPFTPSLVTIYYTTFVVVCIAIVIVALPCDPLFLRCIT